MHTDYETIDADKHAPALSADDINRLLESRIKEVMAERDMWRQRYNELLGNPTQDYTKSGSYDPDDGI